MIETKKETEKTILVCFLNKRSKDTFNVKDSFAELRFLAETAGAEVLKTFLPIS